jgi:hypothetical protein
VGLAAYWEFGKWRSRFPRVAGKLRVKEVTSFFGLIYPSIRFAFGQQGLQPLMTPIQGHLTFTKNKQSFFPEKSA